MSLNDAQSTPPSFMIAKKVPTTFYIVLDPEKVNDVYRTKGERTEWELQINDFNSFVTRDLTKVFQDQFERVEVVAPGYAFPEERFVIADVKVDAIKHQERNVNAYTGQLASRFEMKWRFAIRTSDAEEYMFSFSGEASSAENASSLNEHMVQMTENAIGGLLEKWGEAGILSKLKAWSEGTSADTAPASDAPE